MRLQDSPKKRVVLVVEDELPLQTLIKKKLVLDRLDVLTAGTVKEARQQLELAEHVDAIWLDHYLPGGECGLDFVAFVKEKKSKWKNIPLFVVSNTASAEKVQEYTRLGITKYFVKANSSLAAIIQDVKSIFGDAIAAS